MKISPDKQLTNKEKHKHKRPNARKDASDILRELDKLFPIEIREKKEEQPCTQSKE